MELPQKCGCVSESTALLVCAYPVNCPVLNRCLEEQNSSAEICELWQGIAWEQADLLRPRGQEQDLEIGNELLLSRIT